MAEKEDTKTAGETDLEVPVVRMSCAWEALSSMVDMAEVIRLSSSQTVSGTEIGEAVPENVVIGDREEEGRTSEDTDMVKL